MAESAVAKMLCPACNSRYDPGVIFCARDGAALIPESAPRRNLVGQVLAERYRIVRLIGEGGMGRVYEAQHVNINKRFALKLLRAEVVSNVQAVARFRQEAWSASSIGHENIVEIDDFALLPDGSIYLAMEYLEGQSLAERMRAGNLQPGELLEILRQVCAGLGAAHAKGIVHRDMKPENVFLARKGERVVVKILDFGIAKVSGAEGNQSLTRTGTIFGTPHYMSPEQALGRTLDLRTDIYSVGVIMYEMFTGRVPFEAESFMGILTKHITAQPEPPRRAAPDRRIPEAVERVILRALAKEPSQRQSSMLELSAELAAPPVVTATFEAASDDAMLDQPIRNPTRLRWIAAVAAVAALLVGVRVVRRTSSPPAAETARPPGRAQKAAPEAVPKAVPKSVPAARRAAPDPPAAATELEVIVDSTPPGAQIWKDGQVLAETPEAVRVPAGQTSRVILRKDGFHEQAVLLDPARTHKVVVRLERSRKQRAPLGRAQKAPALPASRDSLLPPAAWASPAPEPARPPDKTEAAGAPLPPGGGVRSVSPPAGARPRSEPQERLPQNPKKTPELLNPY